MLITSRGLGITAIYELIAYKGFAHNSFLGALASGNSYISCQPEQSLSESLALAV